MTTKSLLICFALLFVSCFAATNSMVLTTKDSDRLHPIYKEECEALCLVDPERCHTECDTPAKASFEKASVTATATLLKDGDVKGGLGDCNIWNCEGNIWQLCCPQAGVVPHQPCTIVDCDDIGPVCSCQ